MLIINVMNCNTCSWLLVEHRLTILKSPLILCTTGESVGKETYRRFASIDNLLSHLLDVSDVYGAVEGVPGLLPSSRGGGGRRANTDAAEAGGGAVAGTKGCKRTGYSCRVN